MQLNNAIYRITLMSDSGPHTVQIVDDDIQRAIDRATKLELAPQRSIVNIEIEQIS